MPPACAHLKLSFLAKKLRVKAKLDETSGTAATSSVVVSKNLAN